MPLPLPPISLDATLLPFAVIAVSMVAVTVFVLGKLIAASGPPPLVSQMALAVAVIGGGSVLLLSLVFVFVSANGTDAWTWVLLAFNFMMMVPVGIWLILVVVYRDQRIRPRGWTWPVSVALVTTGSEVIMGVLFVVGDSTRVPSAVPALAGGLVSVWFFWSMASVMSALLLWAPLARIERRALAVLTAAAFVGPWVPTFPTIGGGAMGVLMAVVFVFLVAPMLHGEVRADSVRLLVALGGAFLVTAAAGLFVAVSAGSLPSELAFGATMAVVMAAEVAYLFRSCYRGAPTAPWREGQEVPEVRADWSASPGGAAPDR